MITYTQFKKYKIDTSHIGWYPANNDNAYFCTPKGAKIFGRAGVDGIHYCTVRGMGDTIFAVNPMELPGKYVRPVARNFEDLLRLLLACCDMNIIEQAWMWDEEQLTEQIEEVQKSEYFDGAALDAIREKCGLEPMENPYHYLYELQESFNYTSIPFTKEYYEMMEENTEWQPPAQWKVTIEGDFTPERGKSGREIPLNKIFRWGNETWHIPSAYLCSGGIVLDFFAEVDPEVFTEYRKSIQPFLERGHISHEEEEQFRRQNPLSVDFRPTLAVNGTELRNKSGHGDLWVPESCREPGTREDVRAKWIVSHYGLDLSRLWVIRRCTFPSEERISEITSLSLKMMRGREDFAGIHFTSPNTGDIFTFTHPVYGTEHTLTVLEYEAQEMETNKVDSEWIFPKHCTAMRYAVTPELPQEELRVQDCADGDSPRRKTPETDGRHTMFCSVIGVIRSSDGPTAVLVGAGSTEKAHTICSSMHYDKQDSVEWRMVFSVKTVEDFETELIM